MRSWAALWLALAAVCGGILFCTAQKVTDGRARLALMEDSLRKERETIRVLDAEWSYLTQPGRLEKLARQYLGLEPLKGRQFVKISDLAAQAPPPAAAKEERLAPAPKEIRAPAPPLQPASPPPSKAQPRRFTDVMQSLGVRP